MSLIPKAEVYIANELNVMLTGLHGVGKTEAVLQVCREKDLVLKYFSCSTLDPFTDLVGVPTPRRYCTEDRCWIGTHMDSCPICGHHLEEENSPVVESLKMIRPREIDTAELLFFDEFNRADEKTQNAVFEIIQFRSINGERLPHVKGCWAAMNPPDGDYKVNDLDPALLDRFDVFIDIQAKPSVQYMSGPGGLPKPIAQALYSWWGEQNQAKRGKEHYISPRRLMKIGKVWQATGDFRPAMPPGVKVDKAKLAALLEKAESDIKKQAQTPASGKLGGGPNVKFQYNEQWLASNRVTVAKYMEENQQDMDTHQAVLRAIEAKHGKTLVREHAELLNALKPSLLEGFYNSLNPGKMESLKEAVSGLPVHRYATLEKLRAAVGLA